MINLEEIKAIENPAARYKVAKEAFKVERDQASARVRDILSAQALGVNSVAQTLGLDAGGFSRRLQKGFTVPCNSATHLCYSFLSRPVHEILLGLNAEVALPRDLSYIISYMMDPKYKGLAEQLVVDLQETYTTARANHEIYTPDLSTQECRDVIKARLTELANDRFVIPQLLCGEKVDKTIRTTLTLCLDEQEDSLPLFSTILFIALETEMPVDYFICPMYANLCDVRLHDSEPGDIIKNKSILVYIRKFLQLHFKLQQEVLQKALIKLWIYQD